MIATIESLIRERAIRAGYRIVSIWESGSSRGDYTLLNSRGYVVISPVSMEEIDRFLSEQTAGRVEREQVEKSEVRDV
jgi:hypothetical protein